MRRASIALVLLAACAMAQATDIIRYEGSSTVGNFISDAAAVYPLARFRVNTFSESLGGELCALRGACDIGGVAREVDPGVLAGGVAATLIGRDAVAVIVHVDNPIGELSRAQLAAIFTGKLRNWVELGGPNLPIKPYVVQRGSATHGVFRQGILGSEPYRGVEVVAPDERILIRVAQYRGAIGQISRAFLDSHPRVKPIAIDGHSPRGDDPEYPITRPLYLVTQSTPSATVREFLRWSVGPQGQAVIRRRFVGLGASGTSR